LREMKKSFEEEELVQGKGKVHSGTSHEGAEGGGGYKSKGTRTLERSGRIGRVAIFLLSKHTASYFRLRADAIHFSAGR
jgi:hypothetical protein